MKRHRWVKHVSTMRWRQLQECSVCGALKWLVLFPNRADELRQTVLYTVADMRGGTALTSYAPWWPSAPECKAPSHSGGSGSLSNRDDAAAHK